MLHSTRLVLLLGMVALQACQSATPAATPMAEMTAEESAHITQGDVARSLGKYDEAMQHYRAAADASQGAVRAHLELATMHRRNRDWQAEQKVLTEAYTLNPQNLPVIRDYAQNALRMGDTAQAAELARQGLAIAPEDIRLLNLTGLVHDRKGEHTAAQAVYQQALTHARSESEREVTRNNLALSLIASGQYTPAISVLEAQLPVAENKPALRQLLALAYGMKGETDKAYELGLQDLSVEQVNENLRFYAHLRSGEVSVQRLFMPAN